MGAYVGSFLLSFGIGLTTPALLVMTSWRVRAACLPLQYCSYPQRLAHTRRLVLNTSLISVDSCPHFLSLSLSLSLFSLYLPPPLHTQVCQAEQAKVQASLSLVGSVGIAAGVSFHSQVLHDASAEGYARALPMNVRG
eukprot:SAG25_NODE_182_length_12512_cov_80.886732_10_plen_138_part_00